MNSAKPIFTGEYIAFSEFDRFALKALLQGLRKPNLKMIEIGSWLGNGSTQVFIQEMKENGGMLYAVDTWRGNPNVDRHQDMVSKYNVFETFRHNVRDAGGEELVKPLVMASRDAAAIVGDRQFDLVFIDADHSYDTTREDIGYWIRKVAPGGVLCGHDCEGRPDDFNREHLHQNRNSDIASGNQRFPRVHPGPILAVDEAFQGQAQLWSSITIKTPDGRVGASTIWYVQIA